ncbi:hypothetical protein [Streptomyces yaizuensis]|uniref:Integral membrane protein n=1 Tax=Streptomyces yaizuensis TaxID=2989713 RepID=A0ABQ5P110_9ACTN|nr:hypothetical protein [Streptomyces sp. YSPA8]GLF96270.1 hypothetical protein SYYSPA8_18255 [Streptomyces sp. YSPA8]
MSDRSTSMSRSGDSGPIPGPAGTLDPNGDPAGAAGSPGPAAHRATPRPTVGHALADWLHWHRPLLATAALTAAIAVFCVVGLIVDERTVTNAPVWLKPLKFSVSFALYTLSLAWMLSLSSRARRTGWWAGTAVAAAVVVEMVLLLIQVVRGRRSHFNQETPFDETIWSLMGNTIVVLWVASLVVAVLLLRSPLTDRAGAWALRLGSLIALGGAALGFLMTLPTAEQDEAAARGEEPTTVGGHSVGVPDGGPSMPLTDWSTTGGDLRIPHFVGMHALQLLPLFAFALVLLAGRLPRLRDETVGVRLVITVAAGYAGLVALTTWQALRGQPLTEPDGATLGTLAALIAATAAGVWFSLRGRSARRSTV